MGLRQQFRFKYSSATEVQAFLRSLSNCAAIEDREVFFVFTSLEGLAFTFDCEVTPVGLLSERAGDYYYFLGLFLEGLTGTFGPVEVEDA
jgi:hypothetical protein